ncbi:MAG: ribbon-helix-helix protein, CopG family [Propionicimonas sp.]
MATKHVLGPDVDLDAEDVRDAHGQRITEARAAELAEDALVKVLGRPSLTAPGTRSPEVKARVPRELRDRLVAVAHQRGTSTSSLIREALEHYLAS